MDLETERNEQYQRKLEWILDQISILPPLEDESNENYHFFLDALFYRFQTAIDATMDVVAMLCKDIGESVSDDYNNIEMLGTHQIFNQNQVKYLKKKNP